MAEGFVLEVKFDLVTVFGVFSAFLTQHDNVEKHFNSALGNGLNLVRLAELDLVLEDVGVLPEEEHLFDIDFGPILNNVLHNGEALFFAHHL